MGLLSRRFALQLLDVVDQCKQLPLGIDFASAAEREAAQPVVVQVPEHRFDDAEPPTVEQPPFRAVDPGLHGLGVGVTLVLLATI